MKEEGEVNQLCLVMIQILILFVPFQIFILNQCTDALLNLTWLFGIERDQMERTGGKESRSRR